jgi:hypothetical protein
MSLYKTKKLLATGLFGTLALLVPAASDAQTTDSAEWNQGQAELQKEIVPGMAPDTYRRKLKDLGYKITATNHNNPDYLEYEIVKGNQTWEVQVDIDEDTNKATEVDIAQNVWQTDATRSMIREGQQMARTNPAGVETATDRRAADNATEARRRMALRDNQYSDRDRANTDQLIRDLETLPVGRSKEFYKTTLRQRGYEISKINKDDADELDLEAVKDGNSVQMAVNFDEDTGRSTEVDASSLWAESESTTRTRETQEHQMGTTVPSDQRSRMNEDTDRMNADTGTQNWERTRSGSTGTSTTPNYPSDRTPSGLDADMDRRTQSDLDR